MDWFAIDARRLVLASCRPTGVCFTGVSADAGAGAEEAFWSEVVTCRLVVTKVQGALGHPGFPPIPTADFGGPGERHSFADSAAGGVGLAGEGTAGRVFQGLSWALPGSLQRTLGVAEEVIGFVRGVMARSASS